MDLFRKIRQALCSTTGHTWEAWRERNPSTQQIDPNVKFYRCCHCGKFSVSRPICTVSRIYGD